MRTVLSNLYVQPMTIDGLTFRTVEHYLQYRKILLAHPALARATFPVESGHTIALGDGFAAQRARRIAILSKAQLDQWESKERLEAKTTARRAKFTPGTAAHAVLLATHNAELWSYAPRHPQIRMTRVEALRDQLARPAK